MGNEMKAWVYYVVLGSLALGITVLNLFLSLELVRNNSNRQASNINPYCIRSYCSDSELPDVPVRDDFQMRMYQKVQYCVGSGPGDDFISALEDCANKPGMVRDYFHKESLEEDSNKSRIEFYRDWFEQVYLGDEACGYAFGEGNREGTDPEKDIDVIKEKITACLNTNG